MEKLEYKGKLKFYLHSPLYVIGVLFLCCFAFMSVDVGLALAAAGIIGLLWILVYMVTRVIFANLGNELVNFATRYGTVQKELLEHFRLPYALIDEAGKILWVNDQFTQLTSKDKNYHKSITSVFPEITRESIQKQTDSIFDYDVNFGERIYKAALQKLVISPEEEGGAMMQLAIEETPLLACIIFDVTELEESKRENFEQRMVTGLVYIDNYDETFEQIEDIKQSMVSAMIDRKINRYFGKADAIVRKLEKDKYFVTFKNKYLEEMEQDKFSILEDIKTTNTYSNSRISLSIGIGSGGETYTQTAEFARAAMNLALGRGGAQAAVKAGADVSYYGIRGREVEKNSRVKARVKAQALREMMMTKEKVICMGHQISDMDALGAAIGVYCAARELGKKCQIVLNTVTTALRPFMRLFSEENGYPEDMFIDSGQARELLTKETLVVVVDTNRPGYTECPQLLERSKSVVVFDHHRQGKDQIVGPLLSYIEPYASSACEMIAEVLQYFSEKVHLSPEEADVIYAGILIDTNNFMTKTGVRTFEAAAFLRRCGAEVTRVRKLLRENMETYKARAEVVRHAEVINGAFAISYCPARDLESPTVVGAQAANELLNIVGIKASFVMTDYQSKIYISARSIDEIDVQKIMERLGGGGHLNVAGAQVEGGNPEEVKQRIIDVLKTMTAEGEIKPGP